MRLLSLANLRERGIGYSRVHLARLERAGGFPRRVRLSSNRIAWLESEVETWMADRIAERDQRRADHCRDRRDGDGAAPRRDK